MSTEVQAMRDLPRYKSHKEVRALKIGAMEIREDKSAKIVPADERYATFATEPGWGDKYNGNFIDTGYYVVYQDGYASWSPTNAFEEGYTPVRNLASNAPERMLNWFEYEHLPLHLRVVSVKFYELACSLCAITEPGPERTVALRKLLEAKDAAVRSSLNPGC